MKLYNLRPEVITALTRTPEVKKQVRVVAAAIRTEARAHAPRKTGALARSLAVDNVLDADGRVVFRVGWVKRKAFYGPMQELGTEKTRAHPHLGPAAETIQNR